jgi:phosphopantetheinyl transferase (holo-ACP synthase)
MKAYGSPAGFLDIEVKKTGPRPFATLKGMSASITLSHDGKFAIATAVLGKGGRKLHRSI